MDKKKLSETDIITKYIMPSVQSACWDLMKQIRQEVKLRDGKVIVRGPIAMRTTVKSADIVLYHKPNMPLAVIEAKANKHEIGKGMQQGLDYCILKSVRHYQKQSLLNLTAYVVLICIHLNQWLILNICLKPFYQKCFWRKCEWQKIELKCQN